MKTLGILAAQMKLLAVTKLDGDSYDEAERTVLPPPEF
jgi:hypothetical protein